MAKQQINGSVTQSKLTAWVATNRPELAIDEQNGTKGFYNRNQGQAWSFQGCGSTWKDVAARLGAIRVQEHE